MSESGGVTLFFVHRGNPFYLKYAVSQAASCMPGCRLVLLGDRYNRHLRDAEWHPIDESFDRAARFALVYRHLSPNPVAFELFCIQRWLVLQDFVERHGIEGPLVYLDSDALVFLDLRRLFDRYAFDIALTREIGPAFTLLRGPAVLQALADFLFEAYTDPALLQVLEGIYHRGDSPFWMKNRYVSDMQLLGLFARRRPRLDLSQEVLGGVFDYAFHDDEGFEYNPCKRIKRVRWDRNLRCYVGVRGGRRVPFHGLHFQVGTKVFLPHHYHGRRRFWDQPFQTLIKWRGYLTTVVKRVLGRC